MAQKMILLPFIPMVHHHFSFIPYAQTTAVLTKVDPTTAIGHVHMHTLTDTDKL